MLGRAYYITVDNWIHLEHPGYGWYADPSRPLRHKYGSADVLEDARIKPCSTKVTDPADSRP